MQVSGQIHQVAALLPEEEVAGRPPQSIWTFWWGYKSIFSCWESNPRIVQPLAKSLNQLSHPGTTEHKYEWKWQVLVTFKTGSLSHITYTCHIHVMFSSRDFTVSKLEQISTCDWHRLSNSGEPLGNRSFTSIRLLIRTYQHYMTVVTMKSSGYDTACVNTVTYWSH